MVEGNVRYMREVIIVETLSAEKGHSFVDVVWFAKSRVESALKGLVIATRPRPCTLTLGSSWPRQCSLDHTLTLNG